MSGIHARPTSALFRAAPDTAGAAPRRTAPDTAGSAHRARHGRRAGFGRRLRRRIVAYRDIEFCTPQVPADAAGPEEDCLLLVHVRKVVGQIHYRVCATCDEGVITGIDIDAHLHPTGLGTRALSHLRSCHPGVAWRSTLTLRTTRDLLRRMSIPTTAQGTRCVHARQVPATRS